MATPGLPWHGPSGQPSPPLPHMGHTSIRKSHGFSTALLGLETNIELFQKPNCCVFLASPCVAVVQAEDFPLPTSANAAQMSGRSNSGYVAHSRRVVRERDSVHPKPLFLNRIFQVSVVQLASSCPPFFAGNGACVKQPVFVSSLPNPPLQPCFLSSWV